MNEIKIREFIRSANKHFKNNNKSVSFIAGNPLKEKSLSFRRLKTDLPGYIYSPFKIEVILNTPVEFSTSIRVLETTLGEFDFRDLLNNPAKFYSDLMPYIDELIYQLNVGA